MGWRELEHLGSGRSFDSGVAAFSVKASPTPLDAPPESLLSCTPPANVPRSLLRVPNMSPEDRAKAVVTFFPAIPEKIRPLVEEVVTRAIKRALRQQLAELEQRAAGQVRMSEGRGKQAK